MDFLMHQIACAVLVALSVERLLHMYIKTDPAVDIVGWFFVGVGSFAQFIWVDPKPGYVDALVLIGASLLLGVYAHPRLRRMCANRRMKDREVA